MKLQSTALILLVAIVSVLGTAEGAKLYRWVDEKGEVHYTDTVPPEQTQKAHRELNEQGLTVNQVDKAKSAEQTAAEKRAKEEAEKKAKEQEAQQAAERERAKRLLDTYASEQDIVAARDRNLAMIDGTINFSKSNLEKLHSTLQMLEKDLPTANNDATKKRIQDNIDLTKKQIADMSTFIVSKQNERAQFEKKFDDDLVEYRRLKQAQ